MRRREVIVQVSITSSKCSKRDPLSTASSLLMYRPPPCNAEQAFDVMCATHFDSVSYLLLSCTISCHTWCCPVISYWASVFFHFPVLSCLRWYPPLLSLTRVHTISVVSFCGRLPLVRCYILSMCLHSWGGPSRYCLKLISAFSYQWSVVFEYRNILPTAGLFNVFAASYYY